MSVSKNYLEQLYEREPELFSEPLKKSALTEADLQEIEKSLGYALPEQYREFLQSYQMQDMTVYISFCGDSFACSFSQTFSREKNGYVSVDEEDDSDVVVDLEWYGFGGASAAECLERIHEKTGEMTAWLEAGYLPFGCFYESYLVFYDLTTGEVDCIHHEDIYLTEDWDDPAAVRICMDTEGTDFCRDFNDFLRLACLGEPYDEDEMIFPEDV